MSTLCWKNLCEHSTLMCLVEIFTISFTIFIYIYFIIYCVYCAQKTYLEIFLIYLGKLRKPDTHPMLYDIYAVYMCQLKIWLQSFTIWYLNILQYIYIYVIWLTVTYCATWTVVISRHAPIYADRCVQHLLSERLRLSA